MPIDSLEEEYAAEEKTADYLHVKVNTLRVWAVRRKGPPRVKIGRKIFYKVSSLKAYLDSQEIQQPLAGGR